VCLTVLLPLSHPTLSHILSYSLSHILSYSLSHILLSLTHPTPSLTSYSLSQARRIMREPILQRAVDAGRIILVPSSKLN
jgi:hypothetical protein